MLNKKQMYIIIVGLILFSIPAIVSLEGDITTYECYFWKISEKIDGVKDSGKDLIICNYPGTTDMYHSYFSEKDMIQQIVIDQGASFTYSGKHPSLKNYSEYNKDQKLYKR